MNLIISVAQAARTNSDSSTARLLTTGRILRIITSIGRFPWMQTFETSFTAAVLTSTFKGLTNNKADRPNSTSVSFKSFMKTCSHSLCENCFVLKRQTISPNWEANVCLERINRSEIDVGNAQVRIQYLTRQALSVAVDNRRVLNWVISMTGNLRAIALPLWTETCSSSEINGTKEFYHSHNIVIVFRKYSP